VQEDHDAPVMTEVDLKILTAPDFTAWIREGTPIADR
jgi:hypothetical protein